LSVRKWNFDFADVEITENKIIVNSTIPYKDLRKSYSYLIDEASPDARSILDEVFQKKRVKERAVNPNQRIELIELFDHIKRGKEPEPSSKAGEAAYQPTKEAAASERRYKEASLFKIHIKEEASLVLARDGSVEKSVLSGKLFVENKGEKDRIWDINIKLKDIANTNLGEDDASVHLTELANGGEWDKTYKIKQEQLKKLPLEITEKINTWAESEEENNTLLFEKEHDVKISLILKNTSKNNLLNINVKKEFPEVFTNLEQVSVDAGDVKLADDKMEWNIEELRSDQAIALKLKTKVTPKTTTPITTGKITAEYTLSQGTFSGVAVENANGYSKNLFTIDKDEREEEPDVWDCKFAFNNKSEFPYLLDTVSIFSEDKEVQKFAPQVIVPPNQDWSSEPWNLESKDAPTFKKQVLFTVLPEIDEELKAQLTLKPAELYVLSFKGEKTYDVSVIPSYKSSPVKVSNAAWSEGPVDLDAVVLADVIPADFRPPTKEDIKLYINDAEIDSGKYKVEISPSPNYKAETFPDEHTLKLELSNIQKLVEPGNEMKVRLDYAMQSIQAKPEVTYKGDCLFKAYPVKHGPEIDVNLIPNPISVTHLRRKESASKTVFPGRKADEYEILITWKNRGNAAVATKVIADQIPPNFTLLKMKPEGEKTVVGENTKITWTFENVEPDQEVEIAYEIKGTGEYSARANEVFTMD